MTIAWALLILRVAVGVALLAHGTQKAFGWFSGPGFAAVTKNFGKQGFQPAVAWAALAIVGEVGGGLSLLVGFLTPLGAAGAVGAMIMASQTHWKNGFFAQKGGFEYPLLLAASVALGISGAGAYSLDNLFGIHWAQALVFGILAFVAILVDVVGILMKRSAAAAAATNTSGQARTA